MTSAPANLPVFVIFASNSQVGNAVNISSPVLMISPTSPATWNDFGHNFDVTTLLRRSNGRLVHLNLKIMFEGGGDTSQRLTSALASSSSGMINASDLPLPFCSLMPTVEEYAGLVTELGFELAVSVLRAAGDAALAREEGTDAERLALIDSVPFHVAMLRRNEAYTAFRRGARYLRPEPLPDVSDAARSFALSASLPCALNAYSVVFDFEADPFGRDRLAVLIGSNGTGKTQILLSIINGLRHPRPESEATPAARFVHAASGGFRFGPPALARVVVFSSTLSDIYHQSLPPWQNIDYAFYSTIEPRSSASDVLTQSFVDCLRDDRRGLFRTQAGDPNNQMIFPGASRQDLLRTMLGPLNVWSRLYLPLRAGADQDFPSLVSSDGRFYFSIDSYRALNEERQLRLIHFIDTTFAPVVFNDAIGPRRLSSGETVLMRFCAQAVASVEKGSLFLFDEPETHLHPQFISYFAKLLHILLQSTGSIAIIATHSAYLVWEVPSRRVRVLSFDAERQIQILYPRMQTFGGSIDAISDSVFFDSTTDHLYMSTLRAWFASQSPEGVDEIVESAGEGMNPESLSYLASLARGTGRI